VITPRHATEHGERFLPCTREVEIAGGIVYRPIRAWALLTYAGEGLLSVRGDHSGCVDTLGKCSPPSTAIHRLYWRRLGHPDEDTISAFLSYPQGMGCVDEYFWGIYGGGSDGPERFLGPEAETEMETRILELLSKRPLRRR
jgi:hypothetical protein